MVIDLLAHRRARDESRDFHRLDIALTAMATRWRAGEQLRLGIAGVKLSASTPPSTRYVAGEMAPPHTINRGEHVVHTGPDAPSFLTVPVRP